MKALSKKKQKIVASEYTPTEHAIMRLKQRFNVKETDALNWCHRFLDGAELLPTGPDRPNKRLIARKSQCMAVIDTQLKQVVTVYQQTPGDKVPGALNQLADYVHPFARKIERHYTKDTVRNINNLVRNIKDCTIQIRFGKNKQTNLQRIHELALDLMILTADEKENMKIIKRLK